MSQHEDKLKNIGNNINNTDTDITINNKIDSEHYELASINEIIENVSNVKLLGDDINYDLNFEQENIKSYENINEYEVLNWKKFYGISECDIIAEEITLPDSDKGELLSFLNIPPEKIHGKK